MEVGVVGDGVCSYIYPREEDWVLARLVEEGSPALVAGVRGAGVSTALERAARLSSRRPPLVRGGSEALSLCGRGYVVADLNSREALEVLASCRSVMVGSSGSLIWLASLRPMVPRGVEIVVLKPLSPPEAADYLSVLGVTLRDESLAEEIVLRTGGMPGDICRLAGEWRGRAIGRREVEDLPQEPPWISEARRLSGGLFRELAVSIALGALTDRLAEKLGVDLGRPWLVRSEGGLYTVWGELAWLQPFMVRALGVEEARLVFEEAAGEPLPSYVKYTHASIMLRLTGDRIYAERALAHGPDAYKAFEHPAAKARVAALLAEASRRLGRYLDEAEWLSKLIESSPGPLSSADYAEALRRAKIIYARTSRVDVILRILSSLARRAASERRMEELDVILSEVENLMLKGLGGSTVEAHYFTIEALKRAALGDWEGAERSLSYAISTGKAPPSAYLMAAVAKLFKGDFRGAERIVEDSPLDSQDREYLRALTAFMRSLRPPRPRAHTPRDARIQLIDSLSRAARGLEARPPDPQAAPILEALAAAVKGEASEIYRILSPLLDDSQGYSLIHLLADAMTAYAHARRDRSAAAPAAAVIRSMARSAEASGSRPLAWMLASLARHMEKGMWGEAAQDLARLALYTIYTLM